MFASDGVDQNVFCIPCIEDSPENSISIENSQHSANFTSIGFNFDEPFDLHKLKIYLDEVLRVSSERIQKFTSHPGHQDDYGDDTSTIYRMKGMIRVEDTENLYILQSVYDVFDIQPSDYKGKSSSIIIIGFHLNENELRKKFRSCIFTKAVNSIEDM